MNDRIALVTPWPPAHTGIADFVRDLAIGMSHCGYEIDVYTNSDEPTPCPAVTLYRVSDDWDGEPLADYRYRLYEIGNNVVFHAWMLRPMARFPGVVHLHDMVLHHLFAGLTCAFDEWGPYQTAILNWYGEAAAATAMAAEDGSTRPVWETPAVIDMPLFEVFVQPAEAVIVHSRYAAARLVQQLPRLPVRQVDQTYLQVPLRKRTGLRRIGVFGGVEKHKKVEWIIEAFKYLGRDLEGIQVVIAGTVSSQSQGLRELASSLEYASIDFVGRIDEDRFIEELDRTDLCISLRHPTMGETSAIVMRALQMGLPTIVSDTGWYSELPAEVLKAPLNNTAHFISSRLHRLITEPERFTAWAAACADLPATLGLSHDRSCREVIDFMECYRAEQYAGDLIAAKLVDIGFIGDFSERHILGAIGPSMRWPWSS